MWHIIINIYISQNYRYSKTSEYPEGKFINYHAGPAHDIEMNNYPIITSSIEDPIYVIEKYLSKEDFINLTSNQINKIESEFK